jgi:3-oxoacyl-[acyl-carrier protein] reductase
MDLGLAGRTALVTAASRGFGRATALELAREGAHVAICARGAEDLEKAAREVDAAGPGKVVAGVVDVTDKVATEAFARRVEQELGPVDCLLANAGGPPAMGFAEIGDEGWQAAFELNLMSTVRLCRLVLPGMKERGFGRIVQVGSVTMRQPVENLLLSNVIRPATHALIRNLAVEAAPHGVTVNTVAPGFHVTTAVERLIRKKQETEGLSRDEVLGQWTREIPAGRLGEAEELAALIVFLMSVRAGYLTGQMVVSDGGWVRGTF